MDVISRYKKGNKELRIYQDEQAESPREWVNLGIMLCFHPRYSLGDEHTENSDSFTGWEEIEEYLIKEKKAIVILPLYLYDHSGISMSTVTSYPFNCRWDAGKVGFIYATAEDIKKNFEIKKVTEKIKKKTAEILIGEVETYDQYLKGDIYGFEMVKIKKCKSCGYEKEKHIHSCWGYYGSDIKKNGILDNTGIKDIDTWELVKEA